MITCEAIAIFLAGVAAAVVALVVIATLAGWIDWRS